MTDTMQAPTPRAHAHTENVVTKIVAEARRRAAEGRDVVRLDVGEPDFPTPPHIVEAGIRALRDGETRYVASAGLPMLRAVIASAQHPRGLTVAPENVVVSSGAKPMLLYALLSLVHAGDEVLVPDPGYPSYAAATRIAGGRPRRYALARDGASFRLDVGALRAAITPATRVLVLNSPQNPTGCVLSAAELSAVAELASAHDLWIVSDEIYSGLCYDEAAPPSIASFDGMAERTVVVDGFSKTYAMTGWRLGYGVMPASLAPTVTALISESTTCAPAFVQHAGLAALTGPQDAALAMRDRFRIRRDALVRGLTAIDGIDAASPGGAFYVFADTRALAARFGSCTALAERLLVEHDVACVPGAAYGPGGEGMLRLAFTTDESRIAEGVRRIGRV